MAFFTAIVVDSIGSDQLLSSAGPFARVLSAFTERPGQIEMAALLDSALAANSDIAIEAPSGSGKTLAYLVPLLRSSKKVIISTANHYLQQQLVQRDIPLAQRALASTRHIAVLMGRGNYLCPYYLEKYTGKYSELSISIKSQLTVLLQAYRHGRPLANMSGLIKRLKPYATSTSEECLGAQCSHYQSCPYVRARAKVLEADIIVVNHSLLFSDQVHREQQLATLLPQVDTVLVDEAHRLAEFSQSVVGDNISSAQLRRFCNDVLSVSTEYAGDQRAAIDFVRQLLAAIEKLQALSPGPQSAQREHTLPIIKQFEAGLKSVASWLYKVRDRHQHFAHLLVRNQQLIALLQRQQSDQVCCWIEGNGKNFVLRATAINLSASIKKLIAKSGSQWIFTSATLMVEKSAGNFLHSIGMPSIASHRVCSDFDHLANAHLYLPQLPVAPLHEDYSAYFVQQVLALLHLTQGRVLCLFTSHRALNKAAGLLTQAKETALRAGGAGVADYALLVQGAVDNGELIKQFQHSQQALLLGSGTFWEGLDLSSAPLAAVIVDKLPFAVPLDPLIQQRTQQLSAHGIDSFQQFILPEAVIRLRQACGRLLRRSSDSGVIMLADPRLLQSDYGAVFLNSLPPMRRSSDLNSVAEFVARSRQYAQ
ncbi:MAG: ATP-dependent DNA helicase DinG [Paraglaciecola psychrophila]